MDQEKVLYFGYGTNRDLRMMKAITGAENLVGRPATLKGFGLFVQRFDQIPNVVSETAPAPVSPRQLIKANWPDTFTSYTIKPDAESKVRGTLWELTPEQRELVRDWELIDFGWYHDATVDVTEEDGRLIHVQTETLGPGQEADRKVDGTDYETWLNPPEDFDRIAALSRQEYFERIEKTTEGATEPIEGSRPLARK